MAVASRIASFAAKVSFSSGRNGSTAGMCSWKLVSRARIATAGADSVLLIAACLDDGLLDRMLTAARALGMEPLLETHSNRDLERALATDAEIIGVNARDLETLEVDFPAALERLRSIPSDRVAALESGIASHADVAAAVAAGASAILVGEALMRSADAAAAIAGLIRGPGLAARGQSLDEEGIA